MKIQGYLAVDKADEARYYASEAYQKSLSEAFKGQTQDIPLKFPKGLGAKHPFNFEQIEKAGKKIGLLNGAVNKLTDSIMGDFTIEVDDQNAQALIDDFIHQANFMTVMRSWIAEGVSKGNGFLELDLDNSLVRVMNANNMYVRRNKKGKVLGYNQFVGNLKNFTVAKKADEVVPFAPDEMAHLLLNKIPNEAYGLGYVSPVMVALEYYTSSEIDKHELLTRKAGAPIHVKVGVPGEAVNAKAIEDFKAKLQYMNNQTEWVSDANVEMKVIDFGDIGKNLEDAANHDIEQIAFGMGIPLVLLGKANVPEGLAEAQSQTFQKFVNSIRLVVETTVEEKIIRPLLRNNKLDFIPKFIWELPSDKDKNEKVMRLTEMIKNPFLSPELKAAAELDIANILGYEEAAKIMASPKEAQTQAEEDKIRQEEEEEIQQPEVPGAKPTANQKAEVKVQAKAKHVCKEDCKCEITEAQARDMTLAQYVNITEIAGFQYTDYLIKILQRLKSYQFEELAATDSLQLAEGLLPAREIEKLRVILRNGFKKNKTIRDIERDIERSLDLHDRTKTVDGDTRVTLSSDKRPLVIARTETVRLANAGLKDLYVENDVKQYRYLAALDDRTSAICESLNGQVFNVLDGQPGVNMPPMHANCRSTIVGLVD